MIICGFNDKADGCQSAVALALIEELSEVENIKSIFARLKRLRERVEHMTDADGTYES
jgi:hypothetical protein